MSAFDSVPKPLLRAAIIDGAARMMYSETRSRQNRAKCELLDEGKTVEIHPANVTEPKKTAVIKRRLISKKYFESFRLYNFFFPNFLLQK